MLQFEYAQESGEIVAKDAEGVVQIRIKESVIDAIVSRMAAQRAQVEDAKFDEARAELPEKLLAYVREHPGRPKSAICSAQKWGYNYSTVGNVLLDLEDEGKLMRKGPAFYLPGEKQVAKVKPTNAAPVAQPVQEKPEVKLTERQAEIFERMKHHYLTGENPVLMSSVPMEDQNAFFEMKIIQQYGVGPRAEARVSIQYAEKIGLKQK